eukprot:scaffold24509_cov127-Cylindrotheca_fusiformis.AAC.2
MGNRVKGREKKKSIKAASHSKMGSKRKLSRMGKKQKRHNSGLEATFIGRSKCLKMLQITIKDFRRLCILKGIYPREPRGRFPGQKKGQTFYHIKDIRAIAHEPILDKFREFRAFMKKIRRAAGRNEKDEAVRKNAICPTYTLHHLVRERYPRFNDALADLDDALTLTYLFAALPGTTSIKSKVVNKAKSLAAAWGAYCSTAACITKSFISVKGVYLEASIRGVPIRWVVPHAFTQFMPEDVDYRVMTTFFEFYETLLQFVLYKLYTDIGVRYPLPSIEGGDEVKGSTSHILGANLRSLTNAINSSGGDISELVSESIKEKEVAKAKGKSKAEKKKEKELIKSVGAALNNLNEESDSDEDNGAEDDVDVAAPLKAALESMVDEEANAKIMGKELELDDDSLARRRLFSGFTFFLSREVPRGYLELVCLAFGGKVGWEGSNSPIGVDDPTITHHVVDRPKLPSSYSSLPKSREFVQPQWILDCANFVFLLPVAKYSVGASLPPHLSPWVDNEEEGYTPAYAEEIERLKNGEPAVLGKAETDSMDADSPEEAEEIGSEAESKESESEDESDGDEPIPEKKKKTVSKKSRAEKRKREEEEEAKVLAKTMMSRKAAHLYGRMQHGINNRNAKVENLKSKRKAIEEENRSKKKDNLGRTPAKQKLDRLKSERKRIEDEYSNTGGSMKKSKHGRGKGRGKVKRV